MIEAFTKMWKKPGARLQRQQQVWVCKMQAAAEDDDARGNRLVSNILAGFIMGFTITKLSRHL